MTRTADRLAAAVELRGVEKSYGSRTVLKGADLELVPGEIVAVVGPSGTGKSTLLAIVGAMIKPDVGSVVVDNIPVVDRRSRSQALLRTGWVFQTTNVLGRRSTLTNAALPLLSRGARRDDAERRALAALATVGLEGNANQHAFRLSGGELQRLCIARAIVTCPVVLVADEPTGQLDAATSSQVMGCIANVAETGAAVLVATHDREAASLADRTLRLHQGVLQ